MRHAFQREPKRVDRGIGHFEHRNRALGERRLLRACGGHINGARRDARARAVRRKVGNIALIVALHSNEIATRVLDRLRRHALENVTLGAALHRRIGITRYVTRAAVQQPMVAPGCASVDVVPLDQNAVNAAQGQITRQRRAGDAAADDQDLGLDDRWEIQCH